MHCSKGFWYWAPGEFRMLSLKVDWEARVVIVRGVTAGEYW